LRFWAAARWRGRSPRARSTRVCGALVCFIRLPDDPESTVRRAAFEQALKDLGWTNGSNLRIDYRWAQNDPELIRKFAPSGPGTVRIVVRRSSRHHPPYKADRDDRLPGKIADVRLTAAASRRRDWPT
jgi:hypothetical protein